MKFLKEMEKSAKLWLRERNVYFGKKTKVSELNEFLLRVRPKVTSFDLIRIGEDSDGGYLLPDDFEGIDACFSPGVSVETHFESALSSKGIISHLADFSVDQPEMEGVSFSFEKKFLGIENDAVHMTLESWVSRKAQNDSENMILQMDIEGDEYDVIFDTSNDILKRFRIIVIEFHRLDTLLDRYGYQIINTAFRKLLKNFSVVHIHPNNCSEPVRFKEYDFPPVMEFTFLRNDRISEADFVESFPHELDRMNVPGNNDFTLPKCWYASYNKL